MKRKLLFDMVRIRRVEEAIAARYPEQQMRCPTHLCIGQEATAVGVCAALGRDDVVMSGHRSHGHYLAKGGNLDAMIAELYGRASGCSGGKGGSMHLLDTSVGFLGAVPIVSSTIPIAVGLAFGFALRGESKVSTVFFGDAAVEEGVTHEAMAFAMLEHLPVLFVCENNLYSVQTPLSARQPAERTIADLARGHGMEAHAADGNDVVAVYDLARRAVDKARSGGGPTFLELATYRWLEHVGPYEDVQLGYRSAEEVASWRARCPIERARQDVDLTAYEATLKAEIDTAFQKALAAPEPAADALLRDVSPGTTTPLGQGA